MSARESLVHAVYPEAEGPGTNELIDAYRAEVLAEVKFETVAWLVKKAAEQQTWDVAVLASKVDRGAVRAFIGTAHYRDAMDAHRAQVLNEAGAVPAADEWVFCTRCRSGERYGKTAERGWTRHAGGFLCPQDASTSAPQADELAAYKAAVGRALELIETSPEAFFSTTSNNLRAAAGLLHEVHDATDVPDFFRPGHSYTTTAHADIAFDCLAVSVDPETGAQVAVGWRYGPPLNGVRPSKLAALDAASFACCDWTEGTTGGAQ